MAIIPRQLSHLSNNCVVVNGLFPSLTVEQVLGEITAELLHHDGTFTGIPEHLNFILARLEEEEDEDEDLFLIVHNIDGPNLRGETNQGALAQLAAHPRVHLICSIDHINAPLLWDQGGSISAQKRFSNPIPKTS